MAFADLSERFDDALHLPVDGVVYDIPSPDHELGLWVTALVTTGMQVQQGIDIDPKRKVPQLRFEGEEGDDNSDEGRLYARLLGPAYDELRANRVSWAKIKFVSETAMIWIAGGIDLAEAHWNGGGSPKETQQQLAPNRAARRRATGSTGMDTGSTTGRPASMKVTTSRSAKSAG
jgi:hypothetical protein